MLSSVIFMGSRLRLGSGFINGGRVQPAAGAKSIGQSFHLLFRKGEERGSGKAAVSAPKLEDAAIDRDVGGGA